MKMLETPWNREYRTHRRDAVIANSNQLPLRERILTAATRLFAQLGYDATSTELIAQVVGVSPVQISAEVGGKRALYSAVMERAHQDELAVLEEAAADFTPDLAGVHEFIDHYLDFCLANPAIPALWMQRRLSDAADFAELERLYVFPAGTLAAEAFRTVVKSNVSVEFTVWMIVWCTHSFVAGGVLDESANARGPDDPRAVGWFRHQLKLSVGRMMGLI